MQTHDWEALLDGTTEGPWKVYNEDSIMILDADDTSVLDLDERYLTHKLSDVRLAAHAPAAVAEVIRLRRAFEELRDFCAQGWSGASPYTRGMKDAYESVADDLTRILEGTA